MRSLKGLGLWGLALFMSPVVWAACPNDQVLKPIGADTGSAQFSTAGALVAYVAGICTSTACEATLYDGDTLANGGTDEFVNGRVKIETGGGASVPFNLDLTSSPVLFTDGVYFHDDGNVQGIVVLGCAPRGS